jgi:predicted CXXCH cytochrome family protein
VGACLACHLPHESRYEGLLKSNVPQLCIDCHTTWDKRDVKAHSKGKMCTQCHNPHAGNNRFFLEEGR